jgi:hypothetical protein
VIDGDTFQAQIVLGFNVEVNIRIRVRGYNAAEMNTKEGVQKKLELEQTLGTVRNEITVRCEGMSFNRHVCDVWIGGVSFANAVNHPAQR